MQPSTVVVRPGSAAQAGSTFLLSGAVLMALGVFVAVLWTGQAWMLNYIYPAAAVAVAAMLFAFDPPGYLGFMWWIWFVSPLVRRVVDLHAGFTDPSLILLTPYLVAALAGLTLLAHARKLLESHMLPFLLALVAIGYGYLVGVAHAGLFFSTLVLLKWVVPIFVGAFVVIHWQMYPQWRRATLRAFLWGGLVMGAYALYQYFLLGPWDVAWMRAVEMGSIGKAEPMEVRVFSTLNSPSPFASVMMAVLLLVFAARGPLPVLVAAPAVAGFALSLSRAAWGAWFVGLTYLILVATPAMRARLIRVAVVGAVVALPLLATDAIQGQVSERAATLTALDEDTSLRARMSSYQGVTLNQVVVTPVGLGLGRINALGAEMGAQGLLDSGVLTILLELGWPGGLLFFFALGMLLYRLSTRMRARADLFALAATGAGFGITAQLAFGKTHTGVVGVMLWAFLGLACAAHAWKQARPTDPAGR